MSPTLTEIRDQVTAVMRRRGVRHAAVFGSVARGDAGPESDVDFLVEFEDGRTLLDLSGLIIDLRETLGRDVDAVTRGALHPMLRDAILREAVPIL
jgi:predicted nucleotidyltransferase